MISHELRTPLASIKGFPTILLAEEANFKKFLSLIDKLSGA